jgi:hypothetical protein
MRPINAEVTMGHDLRISDSYWKPTEREILEDYLKAVQLLTINGDNLILQKKVEELTEKTSNNDYLLKAKLQEKDDALVTLRSSYESYDRGTGVKEAEHSTPRTIKKVKSMSINYKRILNSMRGL